MMTTLALREHYFNKFGFALALTSAYHDEGCEPVSNMLHIHLAWMNLYLEIPRIIKSRERSKPSTMRGETRTYTEWTPRQYGFSFCEDAIHTYYGIQPGSWSRDDPENSDHTKLFNYFWNFEHVRHDAYFVDGKRACSGDHFMKWSHRNENRVAEKYPRLVVEEYKDWHKRTFQIVEHFEFPMVDTQNKPIIWNDDCYVNWSNVSTDTPVFQFHTYRDPYDGELTVARTNIEEREWIRGKWKWMRAILQHVPGCRMVHRVIDIWFRDQVGYRKGDWKGGTLGMSYAMKDGESMYECWHRFVVDQKEIDQFKRRRGS